MAVDRQELERARARWQNRGNERPHFAETPGPGKESVWDYPRPPRLERDRRMVNVRFGNVELASSCACVRVLETASPPTFYIPPDHVRRDHLVPAKGGSLCEWKGQARYWSVEAGDARVAAAAWSYPNPLPGFEDLRDYVAFYPARVSCWVDDERVQAQPGGFYGGWITAELVGPFKGAPGTQDW